MRWLALAALIGWACFGQSAGSGKKTWKPPRTPDGQPDFQGYWNTATLTPLERPPEFAGREFLTAKEAADFEKRTLADVNSDRRDGDADTDLRRNYNEWWRDRGRHVTPDRRTSIIVDPANGRIPPFTPETLKKRAARAQQERDIPGPEALALRIRCISRDLPMIPTPNNNFIQIVQGAGFVAIYQEMMHEPRLIPLDGRPHADPRVRGYMGDSRGRWEGGTLVIDTTNFTGNNNFYGADESMHLTERLTRTDPDTILYRFTVDDPSAFTRPWTGEMAFERSEEAVVEYACNEGNYSMTDILSGARVAEKNR